MTAARIIVQIPYGDTLLVAEARGFREGLPYFGWDEAPAGLYTTTQLHEAGWSVAGLDPVALLVFRHRKPYARETVAELFALADAALRPEPSTAQRVSRLQNLQYAMRARRTCVTCTEEQDYCVPTSTRQCWSCLEIEMANDVEVAA
ncbi:RRQRL motif-containing zinc-binding protein [Amycolatopsis sp. NPDC052450]|uniref:RRQRL motif-containing zinc-binding protein n=1 Tax=Amycolatopsis sp. NPDC052450 TaxID=3363937 RepID=UPI0037CC212D